MSSENDAIILDEVKKKKEKKVKSQPPIPRTHQIVRPLSRGEGTACKYDAWSNIVSSGGFIYMLSTAVPARVYKIWPHHCAQRAWHAGFPQTTEKKRPKCLW